MGWWARVRGVIAPVPAELVDGPLPSASPPPEVTARPRLRAIALEAMLRQDQAEAVLVRIRRREAFGEIARQAGPLVRRFFALRDALPPCRDDDDLRIRAILDVVLHHDAMTLSVAMDLLACEWRSERIARQVDTFDGLGPPARLLEAVSDELRAELRSEVRAEPLGAAQLPR